MWPIKQKGNVWAIIGVGHLNITLETSRETNKGTAARILQHSVPKSRGKNSYIRRPPTRTWYRPIGNKRERIFKEVDKRHFKALADNIYTLSQMDMQYVNCCLSLC